MNPGALQQGDDSGDPSVDAGDAADPSDEQLVSMHWRGGLAWHWMNVEGGTFVTYPDSSGFAG